MARARMTREKNKCANLQGVSWNVLSRKVICLTGYSQQHTPRERKKFGAQVDKTGFPDRLHQLTTRGI